MKKILPDKRKATLVYNSSKLGSNFNIKGIRMKERKHDLVYSVKCPEETCNETYNGENRGGSRAAATSKMERFVIIVNGWKPLTIITKRSILDAAAALDPPLETGRRLVERIDEHRGRDKNSQHSVNSNHAFVTLNDFTFLNSGYKHSKFKRKISEALFMKSNRPNLNKQDTPVPLKLFN